MNWLFIFFDISFIGNTFQMFGEVMIAYTVLSVHYRMWQEHKIDKAVFIEMRRERIIGIVGISLIVAGYLLQLINLVSFELLK